MIPNLANVKTNDTFLFGKYQVESEDPWEIEWEVVDDTSEEYIIAQTKAIIDLRCFDAKEPTNPDNNRAKEGNNNWQYSNIKQFLNSDQESWYSAQHTYDEPPNSSNVWMYNPYDTHKGFLYYFSDEEKAFLQDVTLSLEDATLIDGSSYTWTGKVWLPTYTQMGLGSTPDSTKFSKYTDDASRIKYIHEKCAANNPYSKEQNQTSSTAWYYWISSANQNYSHYGWRVGPLGTNGNCAAYYGIMGLAPCIKLPKPLSTKRTGFNPSNINPLYTSVIHNDKNMVYIRKSEFAVAIGEFDFSFDVDNNDRVYKIDVIPNFSSTDSLKLTITNTDISHNFSQIIYCYNEGVSTSFVNYTKTNGNTKLVLENIPDDIPSDATLTIVLYCIPNI